DAIVMIENIARHLEIARKRAEDEAAEGREHRVRFAAIALEAAFEGASEIGFTIISLTVSLIAVLIPLLFMRDVIGRLFREFAVTLSVTILLSAVISLTLTPMMCSRLLKRQSEQNRSRLYLASERLFNRVVVFYRRTLHWV